MDQDGVPDDPKDTENYQNVENDLVRELDIFTPPGAGSGAGKRVFVWVHGGAWTSSTKEMYAWLPKVFTGQLGWITVVVEYRELAGEIFNANDCPTKAACAAAATPGFMDKAAWWPAPIDDVADAVHFVYNNIAAYGGDPNDIYLAGQSAGGNLVALLALHADYADLRGKLQGVVAMSPPSDPYWLAFDGPLTDANLDPPLFCRATYQALLNNFFEHCRTVPEAADNTGRPACSQADIDVASPTKQVKDNLTDLPDMLLMQGGSGSDPNLTRDFPCLKEDIDQFAAALTAHGYADRVQTYTMEGYGHVSSVSSLEHASASVEPQKTIPFGDYGACYVPFGMNGSSKVSHNVTEAILNWIACRKPAGC